MNRPLWTPCPCCGRENASDGYSFCGSCNRERGDDLAYERAEARHREERTRGELI